MRANPTLLPQVIEEALRWEPPVQSCTRFVTRPVVVQGVALSPGEMVQCMVGAANRDPEHFADPDVFDLGRPNARDHLSFAIGKHFCLGAALARLEGEIGLRLLLERLPGLRLDTRHKSGSARARIPLTSNTPCAMGECVGKTPDGPRGKTSKVIIQ